MSPPFRIPTPAAVAAALVRARTTIDDDALPMSRLQPRLERHSESREATTKIVGIVFGAIVGLIIIYALLRTFRSHNPNPKYIPTPFLKRLWTGWRVPKYKTAHAYQQTDHDEEASTRHISHDNQAVRSESSLGVVHGTNGSLETTATSEVAIDRTTSVRSVMTLPAYRPKAAEHEQVLGVEGERDGIDVVLEMPTGEEEEMMREEEMESLYQIRAARRRQIADREERRRLRREARQNNDVVALRELREQARLRSEQNAAEIEELREAHERVKETRTRAVSSVSYADLGVARADGTRLRANSTDSERVGLLSDAASIGASSLGPGATGLLQRRDRSASMLSIDTARSGHERPISPASMMTGGSYGLPSAGTGVWGATPVSARSRANSAASANGTPMVLSRATTPRAGSSPEIIDAEDADLGDMMPPPGYDEVSLGEPTPAHSRSGSVASGRNSPYPEPPPDYPGPAQSRSNRLSAHMGDLATRAQQHDAAQSSSPDDESPRGRPAQPRLPALRLDVVPQIVIEPSSARP